MKQENLPLESAHAELSASSSHRWISCPASVSASRGLADKSSEAALEGTVAHELAEECLRSDAQAKDYVGKSFNDHVVDDDMGEKGEEEEARWMIMLSWIGLGHLYNPPGYSVQLPLEEDGIRIVSGSLVETIHQLNLKLDVWTVNNVDEMAGLIKLGVDGIITDRPDLLDGVVENSKAIF